MLLGSLIKHYPLCTAPAVFIRALAHKDLFALVDVDAGHRRHILAHRLAHQVVVVPVQLSLRHVGHHLIDAQSNVWVVPPSFIDDLAILDDVTQSVKDLAIR